MKATTLFAIFAFTPMMMFAQFNYTNNGDGTCTITGYTGAGGAVTIPSTIDGLSVATIGAHAFQSSSVLTSITIPNTVTSIEDYAFHECASFSFGGNLKFEGLTNINIGSGITNIGDGAFDGCGSLLTISVDAENSAFSSSNGVLFNKSQTTLVAVPGDLNASYLFPGVGGATYHVPDTVTTICANAFGSGYIGTDQGPLGMGPTNITIGSATTNIINGAFSDALALEAINVDAGNLLFSSASGVLFDKSQTTLVAYPGGLGGNYAVSNGVTAIGAYAFANCIFLTSITIPDSVMNIGDHAFYNSTDFNPNLSGGMGGLANVTIGSGVTNIGSYAFADCEHLSAVNFMGNAPSLDLGAFTGDNPTFIILPGSTGWGATGLQTTLWNVRIQTGGASFGVRTNRFGFNITGNSGYIFVVEACTNLFNPVWQPIQTNTLTGQPFYFSDSGWENYPCRFYKLSPL